ncbi:MAG: 1-acyl-sn-glycerol-3-phosphate acyltransferase, partial [Lachnospiraceae bacterium]|nr:1-acyl-sn-glycerol-3-phosphate acyltransferase [Lachnospiraceae bacterium]
PRDTCVLYVLNHRSMFDILLTLSQFPGPTGYVAKKELQKVPGLNMWITGMHGWFLDRENIREGLKIILACIDQVKNGVSSVAIFPEGTRNKNPEDLPLLPFHEGSFKISLKTGCPIVPVCISGSIALFEKQFPKVRPSRVVVEYMDPIYPDTMDKEEKKQIGRQIRASMEETMRKNQAMIATE